MNLAVDLGGSCRLLVQVIEEGSQATFRDHVTLSGNVSASDRDSLYIRVHTLSRPPNVLSRSGSGRQALNASRALPHQSAPAIPRTRWIHAPQIVAQPQVAPHHVLEQPHSLRLHELVDHVAQYGADGVEPLIGVADVRQAGLVEEDLLHDEDGDRLGELRARLHNAQTERYDLGR